MMRSTPRGRPGPRTEGPAVPSVLLDAAAGLLGERSAGDLSVRAIAGRAGVSPAMISYHFGGKEGLFSALVERAAGEMIDRLERAVEAASPEDRLRTVVDRMSATLWRSPWLPALLLRTVILEPGPGRERFLARLAPRLGGLLLGVMEEGVASGRLRSDLDPRLALLSLLGATVHPFIARPLVERLFGLDYDEGFRRRFVDHTARLLEEGLAADGR